MTRTARRVGIAALATTASLSFVATAAPAHADSSASAWAAATQAPEWVDQSSNAAFYVATPDLTDAQVGQSITITARTAGMGLRRPEPGAAGPRRLEGPHRLHRPVRRGHAVGNDPRRAGHGRQHAGAARLGRLAGA